jgi:hypothetical protein
LHEIKISHFAVDSAFIPFDSDDAIAEDSKYEILAFIIFNAVELQWMPRDINILYIYLGRYDQRISHKLSLNDIPLYGYRLDDLELVVYEHNLLKTHHAPDFSPRSPHNIDYDIVVVKSQTDVAIDIVV